MRVLSERGYAATSMSAIAEACQGVSKGVLTYHFVDKAELMTQVVRSVLDDAAEWMTPRVAGAASYHEALRLYIAANVSFLDTHRVEIGALTEVLANAQVTPGVPELFAASQSAAMGALEALFAGGQAVGEFGTVPAPMLAMALRSTIDAASERLRREPDFELEVFQRDLTALFGRAVAADHDDRASAGAIA